MLKSIRNLWKTIRRLSGDDAYEQYLLHFQHHHEDAENDSQQPLLSREEFFKQWQDKKWTGVKRCC